MNLQHLRYFVVLSRTKNYEAAAGILHITQPSLSYAIKQLEDELGAPLFAKSGRNNMLTSYGERFLNYAEGALKTLDKGIDLLKQKAHEDTVIRIGFLRFLGLQYIPKLIDSFTKLHPEYKVRFECETGSTKLLLDGIIANRLDAVFCAPAKQVQKYGTQIGTQELFLIAPKGHPLCRKKDVYLDDTLTYPYVYYVKGSGMRNIIESAHPGISKQLMIKYEIIEENVVAGFVEAGLGIAIVPQMEILKVMSVEKIQLHDLKIERGIYMVPTATREITPVLSAFLEYAKRKSSHMEKLISSQIPDE